MGARPLLAYTIAFDAPGITAHRTMAKMLVASLRRTFFDGDVLVIGNHPDPVFLLGCEGVREICVETPGLQGAKLAEAAQNWKFLARELIDASAYEKILFIDCDSIVTRNLDHLAGETADILYQPEPVNLDHSDFSAYLKPGEPAIGRRKGVNSGTFLVDASCYVEVMEHWERIRKARPLRGRRVLEQAAWNRLLLDTNLRTRPFERDTVCFPLTHHPRFQDYSHGAILHAQGGDLLQKVQFLFGAYFQNYWLDDAATLVNMLET